MTFGAIIAGDVFQRRFDTIFCNLDNVMIIADDTMVIGHQEDEWDHDITFTKFLETAKKNYIKLNYNKIQYKQKDIEFLVKCTLPKDVNPAMQRSKPKLTCQNQQVWKTSRPS